MAVRHHLTESRSAAGGPAPVSQIDLLRNLQSIVDLDSKISDGALKLPVTEEKLAGAKVARLLVDERDLGSSQAVSAVGAWVQVNHRHPLINQTRVLSGSDVTARSASAWE